jgi:hypothetical protein
VPGGYGTFHVGIFICISAFIMPQTKKRALGRAFHRHEVVYLFSAFLAGAGLALVVVLG